MESNLRNINMLLVMDVKNKLQIEEVHNFIFFFKGKEKEWNPPRMRPRVTKVQFLFV